MAPRTNSFQKCQKNIFFFMDPHGKSTASKLKFVFQYIIFPTWIFSLEEFWPLKPYKGIPTKRPTKL